MIIRTHRFHGQKGLNDTYRRGLTVRAGLLNIRYAYREPSRPYRIAVVVSKKVSKSAVVRNRIRRRIYEIVRHNDALLGGGQDCVISVFQEEAAEMPAPQLEQLLVQALRKLPPRG